MKTTTITVTVYGIACPKGDGRNDYKSMAAVSSVDTPPDKIQCPQGWGIENSGRWLDETPRKLVQIELPDDVSYGWWRWIGYPHMRDLGLYAQTEAPDGQGRHVYARVNVPTVYPTDGDDEAAIDAAIASGVTLSVPRNGKRVDVPVKVLSISPYRMTPEERAAWYDAHRSAQIDEA